MNWFENPLSKLLLEGKFAPKDVIPVDVDPIREPGRFSAIGRDDAKSRSVKCQNSAYLKQSGGVRLSQEWDIDGIRFSSVAAAARHFGVDAHLVLDRLRKGWSIKEAVGVVERKRRNPSKGKPVKVNDREFPSVSVAADYFGIDGVKASNRIRNGWTTEQAFGVVSSPRRRREYAQFEDIDGRIFPKANVGQYKLYLISNRITGKEYVGITMGTLEKRWGEHQSMGKGSTDTRLKRSIRTHGVENFVIELLRSDAKTYKELMEQEIAEIFRRRTYERGYNATQGGEIVFNAREIVVGDLIFPTLSSAAEHFCLDDCCVL